jgi:hypothetical protein
MSLKNLPPDAGLDPIGKNENIPIFQKIADPGEFCANGSVSGG